MQDIDYFKIYGADILSEDEEIQKQALCEVIKSLLLSGYENSKEIRNNSRMELRRVFYSENEKYNRLVRTVNASAGKQILKRDGFMNYCEKKIFGCDGILSKSKSYARA